MRSRRTSSVSERPTVLLAKVQNCVIAGYSIIKYLNYQRLLGHFSQFNCSQNKNVILGNISGLMACTIIVITYIFFDEKPVA